MPMFDEREEFRAKAEACRRLADLSKDAERKAFWLDRAGYWKRLATNTARQRRYHPPEANLRLRDGS